MRIALAIAALVVVPAATPGVDKLILTPAQVGKGYSMYARQDGSA